MPITVPIAIAAARRTGSPRNSAYQNYRRMEMRLLATVLALALAASVQAQQFPSKRVAFVSGVTPGSASDTMARILAEKLQQKWGQTGIVGDRVGAGGLGGAKNVAGSEPDGPVIMTDRPAFTA